jgi:hypothetical protein
MPKPGYIICSASGAVDQYVNSVNVFGVYDVVTIKDVPKEQLEASSLRTLPMRITVAWVREANEDEDATYESQVHISLPGSTKPDILLEFEPFSFKAPVHRLFVPQMRVPPAQQPGELLIECKVRRFGEEEWLASQQYRILVVEEPPSPPPAASPETTAEPPTKGNQAEQPGV